MPDEAANASANETAGGRSSGYRWLIMAMAWTVIVINYMDRTAISYAGEFIKHDFHLDDAGLGLIMSAFGFGYMIMTVGGGVIVDLWGARRVWAGAALAWSLMTAALSVAAGFWPMFVVRAFLGITEGPCFPALTRVVTDWLPMSERGRSTAFGLTAVPLASVIGAPLITFLIAQFNWRGMFVLLAIIGVVWAVAWMFAFSDYPENSPFVSKSELAYIRGGDTAFNGKSDREIRSHHLHTGKTTWTFMLFNPALMANNWAFFSFGYLLFFAINWLPEYMQKAYHLNLSGTGMTLIIPWLSAAVMLIFAGWCSDVLWRRTGSIRIARSHMIWVCQFLSAVCLVGVVKVHAGEAVGLVFLSLGLGFGLMPNAAFYALNADLAGDRAATSLGLMDGFAAGAAIIAPAVTGLLLKATGNFDSAIWLMVGLSLTSVIGIVLFQHPDKHARNIR